ncbi:hypothetical protein ACGFZP_27675 [Kitasatospora sp. NPDC048239]|uniref:hypothetical protein n=1 Tax=Kitasatospora sp. NPDC048239 TaxID=3364046 RepID=UPI00371614CE
MKVRLAYGETGLDIDVDPAVTTVVEPLRHPGAADETAVLRDALRPPVAGPPLLDAGLGKADVRAVSRLWSLPTWDKPATPCLAGRIRYGIPVTGHRLARVDRAETAAREALSRAGLRSEQLRVCDLGDTVRVELDAEVLAEAAQLTSLTDAIAGVGLGAVPVVIDGFVSGRLKHERQPAAGES